jgi:parvulin-like peptidyl-prolyl isomerase
MKQMAMALGLALAMACGGAAAADPLRSRMEDRLAADLIKQGAADGADLRAKVKREMDLRFALEAYARAQGVDKTAQGKAMTRIAEQEALIRELMESERAKIVINEEQLRSDYALRYPSQKQVKARVALFKDEQKAKRELAAVSSGAKSLEQAARESSDETIAGKGGDLGFVALSALPEELAAAMGALKEGESLKAPVSTRFGHFIGKAEAFKQGPEREFDSVKAELKAQRSEIALKERLGKITAEAMKKAGAAKP